MKRNWKQQERHLQEVGNFRKRWIIEQNSSKTTELYTHVMSINNKTLLSPLDRILQVENAHEGGQDIRYKYGTLGTGFHI